MTLTITINCDNAAFEDNGEELSRILDYIARGTRQYPAKSLPIFARLYERIRDCNGNTVGRVTVTE
jgi:hypothetical protein